MQGGFGVGGGNSKGAGGIFNIGKAQVTKVDKHAKNKVRTLFFSSVNKMAVEFCIQFLAACKKQCWCMHNLAMFRSTLKMLLAVMRQSKKSWSLSTSSRTQRNMKN